MAAVLRDIYKSLIQCRGLKCDGCNHGNDYYSNGYRCIFSGDFFHKECTESSVQICNLYHPQHSLHLKILSGNEDAHGDCKLCRGNLPKMYYYCYICDFAIDLICARKEVTITIEDPNTHKHHLSLVPKMVMFTCHLCGLLDDRFPYACNLCDLNFHKDCAKSIPEINYSCHPKHLLKRLTRIPSYSDRKCCLCENKLQNLFYHCSICNFSVDVNCEKNPPPFTLFQPKAHEHSLTLMPQRIIFCNACGTNDGTNPYVCLPCNFMIHQKCIDIPYVIKTSRHDHRIYYNYSLVAGDWKCGVCHKEINWICGAYSCSKCLYFAIHLRCATRFGIWDGIELEGIPENTLEVKSYEIIEEGVIQHFGHENHTLKLKEESDAYDEFMSCNACSYTIFSSQFYSCMECDDFILHKSCAYLPKTKMDSFYKMSTTLITTFRRNSINVCTACRNIFKGFVYASDDLFVFLDVRCGSISEPFLHEIHLLHSLYINYPKEDRFCNACGDKATMVLSCEECEFSLDIKCSILPQTAKHTNDKDHVWALCYGENTSKQCWCEICEEKLNLKKWFYSCDHCGITSHIKCTLGDFIWFKQEFDAKSTGFVQFLNNNIYRIFNNHVTRLICDYCDSRCHLPSVLKAKGKIVCSLRCFQKLMQCEIS